MCILSCTRATVRLGFRPSFRAPMEEHVGACGQRCCGVWGSEDEGDCYGVVVGDVGGAVPHIIIVNFSGARFFGKVVAVEGAEAEDLDVTDEEVVDDGALALSEGVEGDGMAGAVGEGAGILEADGIEAAEDGVVECAVHVAAHDNGDVAVKAVDKGGNQLGRLGAGRPALVVKVGVEIAETATALPVAECCQGRRAAAGGIPAVGRHLGCLAQPAGLPVQQLQPGGVVVYGHELALLASVVAAHAHAAVLRQAAVEVVQLHRQGFLQTHGGGTFLLHHTDSGFAPVVPAVFAVMVGPQAEADVERDDLQVVGRRAAAAQEQQGEKDDSNVDVLLHDVMFFLRNRAVRTPFSTETADPHLWLYNANTEALLPSPEKNNEKQPSQMQNAKTTPSPFTFHLPSFTLYLNKFAHIRKKP